MLSGEHAPADPGERAALARTLVKARGRRWRAVTVAAVAVLVVLGLFIIGIFAVEGDWGWFTVAVVTCVGGAIDVTVKARRQTRTRRVLEEEL